MSEAPAKVVSYERWRILSFLVAHTGFWLFVLGFAFAWLLGSPVLGIRLIDWGYGIAGVGAAIWLYGAVPDFEQSEAPASQTAEPPRRFRWRLALWAACGIPLWAGFAIPVILLLYGVLAVGLPILGCHKLWCRLQRRT